MYEITHERPEDAAAIDNLLDQAFGANRHSKAVYLFRDGIAQLPELCLVARKCEHLAGTIRYWPLELPGLAYPGLLLGPLVTATELAGQGVGAALVRRSLDMARWAQYRAVLLVGDIGYYRRFGFQPAREFGLSMAGEPDRLLALALTRKGLCSVRGSVLPWRCLRAA